MFKEEIFKYELPMEASIRQEKFIPVPVVADSVFLSIGVQNNKPVFWCRHNVVNEGASQEPMLFRIVMTGQDFTITNNWSRRREKFEGTLLLNEGSFVVHVFRKVF